MMFDFLKRKTQSKHIPHKRLGMIEKEGGYRINIPRLLTLREAANDLGLTEWAMRERIWNGQIPVVRFPNGRKIYIDRQDIDNFIKENKAYEPREQAKARQRP